MGTDIHPAPLYLPGKDKSPAAESTHEFDILRGQFLASLNHELRTPLSGVIGMTDLLTETSLEAEQREYVDTIRECAGQLLEALNALLDFSALSSDSTEAQHVEFALWALLDSVTADTATRAAAKGLGFAASIDPLPETIVGDERYLRQILQHLTRNAVKFTIHGDIWLAADIERGPSGARLRIRVRDSGIGIPQDKLCIIFQAFRQLDAGLARSYSGLGLGLALSDKLVRLMGGEIAVDSEVGRGTTFTIRLPLTVPLQHPLTGAADDDTGRRRRPLILVVEDNPIAQRVVGHILERTDCEVVFANDGKSGMGVVCAQPVDLILMDLQMPGMDGFAASKAIRNLPGGGDIPILALTANYSDEHRALCHQIGMQGFLSKPIQSEELLGAINAWLRAPRYEL